VTISTDYVFDGNKNGFYTEEDQPNPLSAYGRSKFLGEQTARRVNEKSIVVRTGWIYGLGGTNFLCMMDSLLENGETIKAISDAFGTPTFAGDLALRLRELAGLGTPGIFHVTNGGDGASYFEFACAVADIGGHDQGLIMNIPADSLQRPAPRPVNSRLACHAASTLGLEKLPHWEDGLERFLKEKAEPNRARP
jgi:dTDP-4-dehydrorhamnose reductase